MLFGSLPSNTGDHSGTAEIAGTLEPQGTLGYASLAQILITVLELYTTQRVILWIDTTFFVQILGSAMHTLSLLANVTTGEASGVYRAWSSSVATKGAKGASLSRKEEG